MKNQMAQQIINPSDKVVEWLINRFHVKIVDITDFRILPFGKMAFTPSGCFYVAYWSRSEQKVIMSENMSVIRPEIVPAELVCNLRGEI